MNNDEKTEGRTAQLAGEDALLLKDAKKSVQDQAEKIQGLEKRLTTIETILRDSDPRVSGALEKAFATSTEY